MLHQTISDIVASGLSPSDYHVTEGDHVWIRVAGALRKYEQGPRITREHFIELFKRNESQSGLKADAIAELLEKADRDFPLKVAGKRFRGNLYRCNGGRWSLVLRQQSENAPELSGLGLPPAYMELLKNTKGLILVTGGTGSGKTTTLASTLEYLNQTTPGHIITLEDPVEYIIRSKLCRVDQRQVGRDVADFGTGLRSALRQDPDILLVGELRDLETVKTALDAANTGHLVFATLHTNSAIQTIERVTSFFEDSMQAWARSVLSQALLGVVSQVLVPNVDQTKRVLAAELLINTPDIRQLIRENRSHQMFNAMDTGSGKGQQLLNKSLMNLVRNGIILPERALEYTYDQTGLSKELTRI